MKREKRKEKKQKREKKRCTNLAGIILYWELTPKCNGFEGVKD